MNQLGRYRVSLIAKFLNKQVYVFVREYLVCQEDLPDEYIYHPSGWEETDPGSSLVDYTPPALTDLGILPLVPSVMS